MGDKQTTTQDGLHCVYGKCQGVPYSPYPCNPGCRFQMSAISEVEILRRLMGERNTDAE